MSAPASSPREGLLRWLLAFACLAVLIFFFSPSWGAFRLWSRVPEMGGMLEVRRGVAVLNQISHLGAPIPDPLHRPIQWRLLFPLIGHVLGMPPGLFFSLAWVGCVLVLGYLVTLLRRAGLAWYDCTLAVLVLGAGSWFFTSTGWLGYFDSWLALGLLLAGFAETSWIIWAACVLTPWVDERFVVAAPLALFCRYLWATGAIRPASPGDTSNPKPGKSPKGAKEAASATVGPVITPAPAFDWQRQIAIPAALLVVFVVIRFGLLAHRSAADATATGYLATRNFLDAPASRIALGVWDGIRGAWLFVAAAVIVLWRQRLAALVLAVAVIAVVGIGLATAQDYSRSMTMVWPVAVFGVIASAGTAAAWLPRLLRVGAFVALLLPAHHVMNDAVNRILYLYAELESLNIPPAVAMPELHELAAVHEMERGNFPLAEKELTLAIRLADNPASPAKQRGVLYASQGRWADAKKDFILMAEHDPENPDAWFMRAQADLATGSATDAHSDFDHAKSIAPADWVTRPDVARFMAKLNQRAGQP